MSGNEMSKEDVANTMMTYYHVRKGGPKDKRIRRVELMGEHTPKPLHWVKVTQSPDLKLVPITSIKASFEAKFGDIGDLYRPLIEKDSNKEREFCLVGFFQRVHAADSVKTARKEGGQLYIDEVPMNVELAKPYFVDLYPRPKSAPLTDYKRMCILQDP